MVEVSIAEITWFAEETPFQRVELERGERREESDLQFLRDQRRRRR